MQEGKSKETDARIVIDRLLREAGWDIENPAMISTEEAGADGRADYLTKNSRTQPLEDVSMQTLVARIVTEAVSDVVLPKIKQARRE